MIQKQSILDALSLSGVPDFKFLFCQEAIELAPEILEELLTEEKEAFKKLLKTPDTQICFGTFQQDSKLSRLWSYLEHYQSIDNRTTIRQIIDEFEPKIIEFSNSVQYSKRYFEMLEYCKAHSELSRQQLKIIDDDIRAYKIRGIHLDTRKQDELKNINTKLSELSNTFSNHVLDSQNEFEYLISTGENIKQLPKDIQKSTREKAKNQGKTGYLFGADPSEYSAIMKYCDDENIRKDFYLEAGMFGSQAPYDNREIVKQILELRNKKAQLLGYQNYAALSLEFKMAQSIEQVENLLVKIAEKARKKAEQEETMLKQYFDIDQIHDWDRSYYMRKYKQNTFNIDDSLLKPYFEYHQVVQGLHTIVAKLYGIQMKKISQESYHSDVEIYEVYRDQKLISYYVLDPFYRETKRSGAWANNLRPKFNGSIPVVINVCNFPRPDEHGISLLTKSDVETIFHEFGHAIHEMSSKSQYCELSGFGVEWDFVEVPSQFMEHWTEEAESLNIFAKHRDTGENIPEDILKNLEISSKIGNGIMTLTQCAYALLDIRLHTHLPPENTKQLDEFTRGIIDTYSLNPKPENFHMYTSFSHIFSGGYAAGYYSYMWAEIIELDILREFKQKGIFNPDLGEKYFTKILSAGSIQNADKIFQEYMGRDTNIEGFFEYKNI